MLSQLSNTTEYKAMNISKEQRILLIELLFFDIAINQMNKLALWRPSEFVLRVFCCVPSKRVL